LGPIPNPQSPIPNPQSLYITFKEFFLICINIYIYILITEGRIYAVFM
jgi:hypothetical protein